MDHPVVIAFAAIAAILMFVVALMVYFSLRKRKVSAIIEFQTSTGETTMSAITLRADDPKATATLKFVDSEGNPTDQPGGTPTWTSSDESVALLEVSSDGLTASFSPGAPGTSTISVSISQDDGDTITATGDVVVVPGEATTAELVFTAGQ